MTPNRRWRSAVMMLDTYLRHGCTLAFQGGRWHLFAPGGDGLYSDPVLANLILLIDKPDANAQEPCQ